MLVTSAAAASDNVNTLSFDQEAEVLTQIDNICGDTWCEGDFNFSFESLKCSDATNSCVFVAYLIDYSWPNGYDADEVKTYYPSSCVIKGFTQYSKMIEGPGELNWDFYEAVSDCVTEMEEEVYDLMK